jgi:PKD repeat protein
MKMKFYLTLIFLLGIACKSFSQTASFSMDTTAGCGPVCINFSDQSANPVSWSWNFGDASAISTVQNPSHCYATAGVYTITLTVTFASSTGTATGTATVYPNPVAAYTTTPLGGNGFTFNDQSSGGVVMWLWDFGDLSSGSTQQNPTHGYNNNGNYTACLLVIDSMGCSDSTCQTIAAFDAGINDHTVHFNWNVFPNPSANGIFTIQFDSPSEKNHSLIIENVMGEKVLAEEISGTTTIDLSAQAAGIYFVRLENGPAQKMIIEK